jgi:hypothetical protein
MAAENVRPLPPGYWELDVGRGGKYDVSVQVPRSNNGAVVFLSIQGKVYRKSLDPKNADVDFGEIPLSAGPARLEAWVLDRGNRIGVLGAAVRRVGDG